MYKAGLAILLIIGFGAPFVYENIWKPRIVNKSNDYFCVSKVERNTMTKRKWLFFYSIFSWIVFLYTDAYQVLALGDGTRISTLIVKIVFLGILCLVMLVCCRKHIALPLRRYLNAKEMINSIEGERFSQIGTNLWYSQNWVRISTEFFPKNAITGIHLSVSKGKSAIVSIVVYTVQGKTYRCNDFSYYDKALHDKVDCLIETLSISNLADLGNGSVKHALRDFNGCDMFHKYMETHTTTEFIQNPEMLSSVVDIIQKR